MTIKCICCPSDNLGEAEYWYHLVSHHKMDGEIATGFAAKSKLIRAIVVCPVPSFMCKECSLPVTDIIDPTKMPQNHFIAHEYKTMSMNLGKRDHVKRGVENYGTEDNSLGAQLSGQDGVLDLMEPMLGPAVSISNPFSCGMTGPNFTTARPQHMESPKIKTTRAVSETVSTSSSQPASEFPGAQTSWLDSELRKLDNNETLSHRSQGNQYSQSSVSVKHEMNETVHDDILDNLPDDIPNETVDDIFNEMEDMYDTATNKNPQEKPENTKPKLNKAAPKPLNTDSICERDGLKFKFEFGKNLMTYGCLQCPFKARNFDKLKLHYIYTHKCMPDATALKHLCVECGEGFVYASRLKKHMETKHCEEKLVCEYCSYSTVYKSGLRKHIKQIHLKSGEYVCMVQGCGKSFVHQKGLERHMTVHTGERNFSCEHCQKRFKTISNLSQHLNTHEPKTLYTCPKCLKTFNFKQNFNIHVNKCTE